MESSSSKLLKRSALRQKINSKFEDLLTAQMNNPVIRATQEWNNVDDLLYPFLGEEIYNQWFKDVKPLFLKNNVLVLQTKNATSAAWINTHYQDLVENILKIQNKELSCFFIAPKS